MIHRHVLHIPKNCQNFIKKCICTGIYLKICLNYPTIRINNVFIIIQFYFYCFPFDKIIKVDNTISSE